VFEWHLDLSLNPSPERKDLVLPFLGRCWGK
jgi:hypothetical protein